MTVDDIESELYERVQRDDLEEVVRDLVEAINILASQVGGDAADEVTALTNRAMQKVSDR